MGGFNRLWELFIGESDLPLPSPGTRLRGWGRVNQWMDTDAKELASVLEDNGCNATLCEFQGFSEAGYWKNLSDLFGPAEDFTGEMRHKGIATRWTWLNWNMGNGVSENGKVSICESRFNDEWFLPCRDFFARLVQQGGVSVLPCSELGVRNSHCRSKGLRWHGMMLAALGVENTRWNGNGDASPVSSPNGEQIEYHINGTSDRGYKSGSLVVTDTSKVLNELGGLHAFVNRHDRLAKCVRQALDHGCDFIHYAFDVPGIDSMAIQTIGNA